MSDSLLLIKVLDRQSSEVYDHGGRFLPDALAYIYNNYLSLFQQLKMDLLCREAYARRPLDVKGLPAPLLLTDRDREDEKAVIAEVMLSKDNIRSVYRCINTGEEAPLDKTLYQMCRMVGWNFYMGMPGKSEYRPLEVRRRGACYVNPRTNMTVDERRALNFIELIALCKHPEFTPKGNNGHMEQSIYLDNYLCIIKEYLFFQHGDIVKTSNAFSFDTGHKLVNNNNTNRHRMTFNKYNDLVDYDKDDDVEFPHMEMINHMFASMWIRNTKIRYIGNPPGDYFLLYILFYHANDLLANIGEDFKVCLKDYFSDTSITLVTGKRDCFTTDDFCDVISFLYDDDLHLFVPVDNNRDEDESSREYNEQLISRLTIELIDAAKMLYQIPDSILERMLLYKVYSMDVLMYYTPINGKFPITEDLKRFAEEYEMDGTGFRLHLASKLNWLVNHTTCTPRSMGQLMVGFYELRNSQRTKYGFTSGLFDFLDGWLVQHLPREYREIVFGMIAKVDNTFRRAIDNDGGADEDERPLKYIRHH